MLTSLSIKNYALIEDIQMNLQSGFTTITGETGAGKSIMLGALSLLLGKRADFSAIRDPQKKCVIEGVFNIESYDLKSLFAAEDLDYEVQTIIRREILPSGKSRAFINDTPANLSSLQVLGERLLDIHSQHETLSLGDNEYQFLVIDSLAGNAEKLKSYRHNLQGLKNLQRQLQELKEEQSQASKEYDYNLFLLNELQEAKLQEGMQEELEERYEELSNVEQLTEQLGGAVNAIQREEIGAAASLREARSNLQKISAISSNYHNLFERLQSVNIELEDITAELETALEKVEANPEELQ
ncbi:MAG: AAA family ATPase, partial [Salinimicrobium sp.]